MKENRWTRREFLAGSTAVLALASSRWSRAFSGQAVSAETSPEELPRGVKPLMQGATARPLRYRPDGQDFVIENGPEFFNRPLYCWNSAFRVDAGDRPEFSLYLPGRGGNLRFGFSSGETSKWLFNAEKVEARYRPGAMIYAIRDKALGSGVLHLQLIPMSDTQGIICKIYGDNVPTGLRLFWAYGGASRKRGQRGGDIGCETQPVSEFFQLHPVDCQGNQFEITDSTARLHSPVSEMACLFPEGSTLKVADAAQWSSWPDLEKSSESATPVLIGSVALAGNAPVYVGLQRLPKAGAPYSKAPTRSLREPYTVAELPQAFTASEGRAAKLVNSFRIETPDPYLNVAAGALVMAADSIWDHDSGSVMHGGVAWRSPLPGWRGPYAFDALGWHDKLRSHVRSWASHQNVTDFEPVKGDFDPGRHETTKEGILHSRGDITNRHYDMNLVFIDALLRHLLWTGDKQFALEMWPVVERHLSWERRLFRRTYGAENLPLYEAYACIWASDNLQYNGGGAAHSTAYNYYQNMLAARIAKWIGVDAKIYEEESALLASSMRKLLWMQETGCFGESKDLFGDQIVHPSPALWTFYHTVDCELPNATESYQMAQEFLSRLPRIPVHGPGVPAENTFLLSCSDWMPYIWSLNLLVLAEDMHTALGLWQSEIPEEAYALFKGNLLDSMYMGLTPGNLHMTSQYSVHRQEAQRDFGDAVGTTSRAYVEGLFGIRPDLIAGTLSLKPNFPKEWDHASLQHTDVQFSYRQRGSADVYEVTPRFGAPVALHLTVTARLDQVKDVRVDGKAASWKVLKTAIGSPKILIESPAQPAYKVEIEWGGKAPVALPPSVVLTPGMELKVIPAPAKLLKLDDPQKTLQNGRVHRIGSQTLFATVQQGDFEWVLPIRFTVQDPVSLVEDTHTEKAFNFRITKAPTVNFDTTVTISIGNVVNTVALKAEGENQTSSLALAATKLLPGSHPVTISGKGSFAGAGMLTNWKLKTTPASMEPVDIASIQKNRITEVFDRSYSEPRSPYCSLAIPTQGVGGWAAFALKPKIDDRGLRAAASRNGGNFDLPQGIRFRIPFEESRNNVAFVSRWKVDPSSVTVPLVGKAHRVYLLMAGTTLPQEYGVDHGRLTVLYKDGSKSELVLKNPTNWWPIEQDYLIDDFQFRRPEAIPPRVDLKTGQVRILDVATFKGNGKDVDGGAATVLDLPLDPARELHELRLEAIAYEVVLGLMAATLAR